MCVLQRKDTETAYMSTAVLQTKGKNCVSMKFILPRSMHRHALLYTFFRWSLFSGMLLTKMRTSKITINFQVLEKSYKFQFPFHALYFPSE